MPKNFVSLAIFLTAVSLTLAPCSALSAEQDIYTKLLIQSETFDGDSVIEDSSASQHELIVYGDIYHSSEQAKFGETSLFFPGGGAYIEIEDSDDWNFATEDFTIDFWINTITETRTMFFTQGWGVRHSETTQSVLLDYFPTQDRLILGYRGELSYYSVAEIAPVLNDGLWHHIAIVRYQNWLTLYCDGMEVMKIDMSPDPVVADAVYPFLIGSYSVDLNSANINGFIEDFRISKGIALWTTNFSPPASPTQGDSSTSSTNDSDGTSTAPDDSSGNSTGTESCYTDSEVDAILADNDERVQQLEQLIDAQQEEILDKDAEIARLNELIASLHSQEQLDEAVDNAKQAVSLEFIDLLRDLFGDDDFTLAGETLEQQLLLFIQGLHKMPSGQIKKLHCLLQGEQCRQGHKARFKAWACWLFKGLKNHGTSQHKFDSSAHPSGRLQR